MDLHNIKTSLRPKVVDAAAKIRELFKKSKHLDDMEKLISCTFFLHPIYNIFPNLDKVCLNYRNRLVLSGFCEFDFFDDEGSKLQRYDDLISVIDIFGSCLNKLNLNGYTDSNIMPYIKTCSNLDYLKLKFKNTNYQDFKNCLDDMQILNTLSIEWFCKNQLPSYLLDSITNISNTLSLLELIGNEKTRTILPDQLALVFSHLKLLNNLCLQNFDLSFTIINSIKTIVTLSCFKIKSNNIQELYPISDLINIEQLYIDMDYGVTDEFLINLCNYSKKLTHLSIVGTNITDAGMIAINNLKKLKDFSLNLNKINKFISLKRSFYDLCCTNLEFLNISYCIRIENDVVFMIVKNLKNLKKLEIYNTSVNSQLLELLLESEQLKKRNKRLAIHSSIMDEEDKIIALLNNQNIDFIIKNESYN